MAKGEASKGLPVWYIVRLVNCVELPSGVPQGSVLGHILSLWLSG